MATVPSTGVPVPRRGVVVVVGLVTVGVVLAMAFGR